MEGITQNKRECLVFIMAPSKKAKKKKKKKKRKDKKRKKKRKRKERIGGSKKFSRSDSKGKV